MFDDFPAKCGGALAMASQASCPPCDSESHVTWRTKFNTEDAAIAHAKGNLKFFPTGTPPSLSECCRNSDSIDNVSVSCRFVTT